MSTIFKFFIILCIFPVSAFAQTFLLVNPVGKSLPEKSEIISVHKNRSIMSCGDKNNGLSVYTSLDIKAILAISNMISTEVVSFETNWDTFYPSQNTSTTGLLDGKIFLSYPKDVQKIIFYCLAWDESVRLKLFEIPQDVLQNILNKVISQKPWKVLSNEDSKRIDEFSKPTISDFIYLILRANVYYSIRGDVEKNSTLFSTPFSWRVPIINTVNKSLENRN